MYWLYKSRAETFLATSFIITCLWKQAKCPPSSHWINKMVYSLILFYYFIFYYVYSLTWDNYNTDNELTAANSMDGFHRHQYWANAARHQPSAFYWFHIWRSHTSQTNLYWQKLKFCHLGGGGAGTDLQGTWGNFLQCWKCSFSIWVIGTHVCVHVCTSKCIQFQAHLRFLYI